MYCGNSCWRSVVFLIDWVRTCFCLSYQNGELVQTREENIITSSINFAAVYACTKYSIHFLMPGCRWASARLIFLSGLGMKNPILYPVGGGEYLNLWAWRVDCEQSLIFLLSHGDWERVWGASGKAALITPPFLPLICIVSLFRLPRGNEERRTTARGLPKEWPTSIFMLNKIDVIIVKGKVHEN